MKIKIKPIITAMVLMLSLTACSDNSVKERSSQEDSQTQGSVHVSETDSSNTEQNEMKYKEYANMTPEQITASLTLDEKAAQMVLPSIANLESGAMEKFGYGGILSKKESLSSSAWRSLIDGLQRQTLKSSSGIPFIYGQDDVHGVNYALDTVIFPHNIGLGAANDKELMYKVGQITADEAKICHMLWNYAPCVAQSVDPRWGRTYESYGSDLESIKELSTAYTKGLVDSGVIACPKHYLGDGNVVYGTGEKSDYPRIIDRGDAQLSDSEINELISVYKAQIDAGAQTIMISHSSLNGVKMHENKKYIEYLKNELGFKGFIVSDWDSVQKTSSKTYEQQVITSVNAGIDMFMEVERFENTRRIITSSVINGKISQERIDDAVTRIIKVKKDIGLFNDPMLEQMTTNKSETGSSEYRAVAEQLVEKSLVLVKNKNNTLPLKKGTKVYITGPAADNAQAQCGGWTIDWNSSPNKNISGVTTILQGFKNTAKKHGIEVITDKNDASKADVVLLVVGEQSYAEWLGDSDDMSLYGKLGLEGNGDAAREAKALGKPIVTCIVAGRQVILDKKDIDDWSSIVMCYLPGSEGQGVADVLCGESKFTGKLPSPWYSSISQIGTNECWLKRGYGLTS